MDTQRIEVLHRSYGETVVVGITDTLKLNLFPAFQALFYENLWCKGKGALCQFGKGSLILTDTATQSAKGVSRADHDGETDLTGSLQRILHILYGMADRCLETHLVELLYKKVSVFSIHNCFY